jgi:hypothetical protein
MLNLIQHLTKSRAYETLKQVQGDKLGLFTRPSHMNLKNEGEATRRDLGRYYGKISISMEFFPYNWFHILYDTP